MYITGIDTDTNDSTPLFDLGQLGQTSDGKIFKYSKVLNETATVAGAAGDVCAYLGSPADGDEDFTVVTDNTDGSTKPVGAGVLQVAVTGAPGTAEYVWLQVSGPFTANQALAGTPADGDAVFLSTTDKTLTLSTAADDPVCAHVIDASADKCWGKFVF